MAGFYYYLPSITAERLKQGEQLDREVLRERGLADVLSDVVRVPQHVSLCDVRRDYGPDQGCGVLLSLVGKHSGAPEVVTYLPDKHPWAWQKVLGPDGQPRYFVGALKNALPFPSDLERWERIEGVDVVDRHTCAWHVPIARSPLAEGTYGTLPQSYVFDERGEPVGKVQERWRWLWERAGQIRDWYHDLDRDGTFREPMSWLVKQAAVLLGVNYRLGLAELNFLDELGRGVLTQHVVQQICQAAIHGDIYDEAKKKPPPGESELPNPGPAGSSSSSSSGDATPADSPGTAPAGAD